MPARAEFVRDSDPDAIDRLWDAVVAGEASLDGRDIAGRDWSETMHTVQRHAQALPGPDPQFGQVLRDQLLEPVGMAAPIGAGKRAVPVPSPPFMRTSRRRHERAWRGWAELAAVAAILLAIFGRFVLPASESDPEPRQAIAPFGATPAPATTENAFFRGTSGRTGQYPGAGVADAVTPLWDHEAPFAEFPMGQVNPAVSAGSGAMLESDGTLYLSAGGNVEALDPATGETIWSQEAVRLDADNWFNPVVGPAVANGPVVYASRARGSSVVAVAALDAGTGEQRWSQLVQLEERSVLGWDISSPLIAGGMVYVVVNDGETPVLPAYDDGRIYTGSGLRTSRLIAFDLETGDETWRVSASRLGAYDAGDGHAIWTSQSQARSLAIADGRVHIVVSVGENKGIVTLDAGTGDQLWRINNPDPTILPLAVSSGTVIAVGTDQRGPSPEAGFARLRIIDAASGEEERVVEWGQVVAGSVSAPSVIGGEVYILAEEAGVGATVLRAPLDEDAAASYLALSLDTHSLVDVLVADGRLFARGERVVAYGAATADASGTSGMFGPLPVPLSCDVEALWGEAPRDGMDQGDQTPGLVSPAGVTADDLVGDVSPADDRAVRAAVARIVACQAVGQPREYLALFSDAFLEGPAQNGWIDSQHTTLDVVKVGAFLDGRIGAIVKEASDASTLIVFVEQDGEWLIDGVAWLR